MTSYIHCHILLVRRKPHIPSPLQGRFSKMGMNTRRWDCWDYLKICAPHRPIWSFLFPLSWVAWACDPLLANGSPEMYDRAAGTHQYLYFPLLLDRVRPCSLAVCIWGRPYSSYHYVMGIVPSSHHLCSHSQARSRRSSRSFWDPEGYWATKWKEPGLLSVCMEQSILPTSQCESDYGHEQKK